MHGHMTLSDDAQRAAVLAVRDVHRSPVLAAEWAGLTPAQRVGYVISVLLNLPADCCEPHVEISQRIIRRFLTSMAPCHVGVRRRACEILAAVALVDGHSPCATPEPPRIQHGSS